jgi:hypothetical protein
MASAAHMRNLNLVATCVLLFGLTSWPTQAGEVRRATQLNGGTSNQRYVAAPFL